MRSVIKISEIAKIHRSIVCVTSFCARRAWKAIWISFLLIADFNISIQTTPYHFRCVISKNGWWPKDTCSLPKRELSTMKNAFSTDNICSPESDWKCIFTAEEPPPPLLPPCASATRDPSERPRLLRRLKNHNFVVITKTWLWKHVVFEQYPVQKKRICHATMKNWKAEPGTKYIKNIFLKIRRWRWGDLP